MASTITVPVGLKPNPTVMSISCNGTHATNHPTGSNAPSRGPGPKSYDYPPPESQGVAVEG